MHFSTIKLSWRAKVPFGSIILSMRIYSSCLFLDRTRDRELLRWSQDMSIVWRLIVFCSPKCLCRSSAQVDILRSNTLCPLDKLEGDVADSNQWQGDIRSEKVGDCETANESREAVEDEDEGEEDDAHPSEVWLEP